MSKFTNHFIIPLQLDLRSFSLLFICLNVMILLHVVCFWRVARTIPGWNVVLRRHERIWLSWQEGSLQWHDEVNCYLLSVSGFPTTWGECPGLVYTGSLAGCLCILRSMLVYKYLSSLKESARTVRLLSHCSHQAVPPGGPVWRILVPLVVCEPGEIWKAFGFTKWSPSHH